jgi:hypothetical protein
VVNEKPRLSPESEKALADKAQTLADKTMDAHFIPKKVPAFDDIDEQTKAVGGALASSLLTATEMPLHMLQPVVGDLAAQMVALGIRQTKHVDVEAVHAPAWITDGVRQQSIKLPDPPKHTEAEPVVARTDEAPPPPKRIAKHARAVKQ